MSDVGSWEGWLEAVVEAAREELGHGRGPVSASALAPVASALQALDPRATPSSLRDSLERLDPCCGWEGHDLLEAEHGRVTLFLLPAGGGIPLHDHPGMTVVQRVLAGRVRVVEHDWLDRGAGLVTPARARVVGPEDGVSWTGPDQGNVHAIVPLEPSAFIDVLTPDYDPESGRPCTYWRVLRDEGQAVRLAPV